MTGGDVIGPDGLNMGPKVFKKKFRWIVKAYLGEQQTMDARFVKASSRPFPDIEETEINFLSSKMWVPGKQKNWEQIEITFVDCEADWQPPECDRIWLGLYDGCGNEIESWELLDAKTFHFEAVDLDPGPITDITWTVQYKTCKYNHNQDYMKLIAAAHQPVPRPPENQVTIE